MITKEAIAFIDDLTINNNKEWMHANKKRYESFKEDYKSYIGAVLAEMKPLDATLEPLEIKNCTFRINRDIRFSKNKQPYKTNISIWLVQNRNLKFSPGYYLHFEKGKSFIAAGLWFPEANELKLIRKEIEFFYEDLQSILDEPKFKKEFGALTIEENNRLKNAPKGYEITHPAIELLKFKSFTAAQKVDDKLFSEPDFAKKIAKKLVVLKPLNDFLTRALTTED